MDVLDFQAEIAAAEHGVYEVTLCSPDGAETSSRTRLPLSADELRALTVRIPDAVIASSARVRRSPTADEQPVQLLGRSLFETLTAGDGRALLAAARHAAVRSEARLRLVLKVRPPELALLPWEFLFDAATDGYVCTTTPLIRHPQVAVPQRPLKVDPPLRVLCMIARPGDQEPLAVAAERQRLGAALEGLRRDGLIELGWVGGDTWRDLRTALRRENGPWHVFHFIGHGGFDRRAGEGALALADGAGGTYQLGAENLEMVLRGCPSLRLVVLNACETGRASAADPFSSVGGALMRSGLPAALVMQYPISDHAAVEFSQSFYEELAQGRTVDAAVTEARQSVRLALPGTLEWGTPVLYMRSLDGMLFDIGAERVPAAAQATQVGDLYIQGLAALYTHRWDDAVAAFRAVQVVDRGYENSAAKLEEALRGRRLEHLYTAAVGAAEAGHWADAVAHLSTILAEDPGYRDAQERLETARRQKEAASLRAEARALHAAGQWEAVLAVGARLAELTPGDADPDGVVGEARRRRTGDGGRDVVPEGRRVGDGGRDVVPEGRRVADGGRDAASERPRVADAGKDAALERPRVADGGRDAASERPRVADGGRDAAPEQRRDPDGGKGAAPERPRVADAGKGAAPERRRDADAGRHAVPEGALPSTPSGQASSSPSSSSSARAERLRAGLKREGESMSAPRPGAAPSAPAYPPPPQRPPAAPPDPALGPDGRHPPGARSAPARLRGLTLSRPAWSVAFSPDGAYLAVGCDRRTVVLTDPTGRRPAVTFGTLSVAARGLGADERALSVAFSPDGRRLALSSNTRAIVLDARRGSRIADLSTQRFDVSALAFCDNSRLAVASDQTVSIRPLGPAGTVVGIDHGHPVYALAVSPDRTRLATAGRGKLRVWHTTTGEQLLRTTYEPMVFGVAFSPDGTRLATAGLDRTARLWDATTGRCLAKIERPDRVRGVAFGPDGDRVALASGSTVSIWDPATGRTLLERDREFGDVTLLQIAYSPDGTHLATVGGGRAWLIPVPKERHE